MDEIRRISAEYSGVRFDYEPVVYYALVRRLVPVVPADDRREEYYELLEALLYSIYESYAGGTVEDDVAAAIVRRIGHDWRLPKTDRAIASMTAIATVLLPRSCARTWLEQAAENEQDERLADVLRVCAATEREDLVV